MLQKYLEALQRTDCRASSLLDPEAVVERTKLFAFHPVLHQLGAHVLDDENTSNHHFLITAGPLSGSIFFLSHDGDSRVVFSDAANFLRAACDAEAQGLQASDLHPDISPIAANQQSLKDFIETILQGGECNDLVVSLLPSMELQDQALLRKLASDSDFFLGEAVALEIEKRPSAALLPIAVLCTEHCHPQVANAGSRAVQRIQQLL